MARAELRAGAIRKIVSPVPTLLLRITISARRHNVAPRVQPETCAISWYQVVLRLIARAQFFVAVAAAVAEILFISAKFFRDP